MFLKKKIKTENWSEQKLEQKTDQKRSSNRKYCIRQKINFAFA